LHDIQDRHRARFVKSRALLAKVHRAGLGASLPGLS
jgi:hypothetical protein